MTKETNYFKLEFVKKRLSFPFVFQYTDESENPKRCFAFPLNTKSIMSGKTYINIWCGILVYSVEKARYILVLNLHNNLSCQYKKHL